MVSTRSAGYEFARAKFHTALPLLCFWSRHHRRALFETLRHFYPDPTPFVFISDEWNGENKDVDGRTRPLIPGYFNSLADAEGQNAESRVYLGVHWQFDSDEGIAEGRKVADWTWDHAFQRLQ